MIQFLTNAINNMGIIELSILLYVVGFLSAYRLVLTAYIFWNKKANTKICLISTAIIAMFLTGINYFFSTSSYRPILMMGVMVIFTIVCYFKDKTIDKIKVFFTFFIATGLFELLFMATNLTFVTLERTYVNSILTALIYEVFTYIALLIILCFKKYLLPKMNKIVDKYFSALFIIFSFIYIFVTILVIIIPRMQIYDTSAYTPMLVPIIIGGLSTIILFLFNIRRIRYEIQTRKEIEQYKENIETLYEETRIFRHNYKNAMTVINGYARQNDLDKLKDYLNKNMENASFTSNAYIAGIASVKDAGIKNLLISKLLCIQSKNISVIFRTDDNIDNPTIPLYVYSEILGILLDNAIQSADGAKNANIYCKLNNDLIEIHNTYKDEPAISRIFDKNYTTKENHSGLGLYHFTRLTKKYDSISYSTQLENNSFIFTINF